MNCNVIYEIKELQEDTVRIGHIIDVDICLPQTGAIYQVCQRDGESMNSFLTRVAKRYNKIKKDFSND